MNILFANALSFALQKATTEGMITICILIIVSLISWMVMITKARQLYRARKMSKKFLAAYRATRDPMEVHEQKKKFEGAPAYEVYAVGAEELQYHLSQSPTLLNGKPKISRAAYEYVRVAIERTVSSEGMGLEKSMIVLSTAVAAGPFIGLLGTVWGVMETFAGIAQKGGANLAAMAPGVAGALIATVFGLFVAIPAMFAYNFMVTHVRGLTQQLDDFATEFGTHLEHSYVDFNTPEPEHKTALGASAPNGEDLKNAPQTTHLARASLQG